MFERKSILENKKGWIRIVEAFISILLVISAVLVIIDRTNYEGEGISKKTKQIEKGILKEIQLNETLRDSVIKAKPPVELTSNSFPDVIKNKIKKRTPKYLNCTAKICKLNDNVCYTKLDIKKEVYAEPVAISANLTKYSPKQIKIFCWSKN